MSKLFGCTCLRGDDKQTLMVIIAGEIGRERNRPENLKTLRPLYHAINDTPTCEQVWREKQRKKIEERKQMKIGQKQLLF